MSEPSGKGKIESSLRSHVFICIILGVALLLADACLEQYAHSRLAKGAQQGEGSKSGVVLEEDEALHFFARIVEAGGIASLIFGLFTLFLELPSLRSYFLDRMKELVIEKPYLKSLCADELKQIQLRAIQVHFKLDESTYEGSFLEFLYDNIYMYIGVPYRERATLEMRYEAEGECLIVHDRLTYICRMSGGNIIPAIVWQNDPEEIERIKELRVDVLYPQGHARQGQRETIGMLGPEHSFSVRKNGHLKPLKRADGGGDNGHDPVIGRELRINRDESYENIDRLKVVIDSTYVIRENHFLYWRMLYPTKDFSLILKFPDSRTVQIATFINHEHVGEITREPGYYSFTCTHWMIPQSGVAWRLIPQSTTGRTIESVVAMS